MRSMHNAQPRPVALDNPSLTRLGPTVECFHRTRQLVDQNFRRHDSAEGSNPDSAGAQTMPRGAASVVGFVEVLRQGGLQDRRWRVARAPGSAFQAELARPLEGCWAFQGASVH